MSLIKPNLPNQLPAYPIGVAEPAGISPVMVLEAGFRNSKLWVWTFGAVALAAIIITAMTSKQYQSEMNIIVENARGTMVITPERTATATTVSGVTEEQVNSEMEVLRSKEIAEAALDPDWYLRTHTAEQQKAHDKALEKFRKSLSIELIRKSNVIHVVYTAKSPDEAQTMLRRLLGAFLAKQREIELPSGAAKFFAEQAARYQQQLEAAQLDLAKFQQKSGLVSLPDREVQLEKQTSDLEADSRLVDLQLAEATHRLNSSQRMLSQIPHRQNTIERTVPYQVAVEQLNTLLTQLKNKREELLTKYVSTDRLVVENDRQITNTTSALARLNESNSQERSTDINPVWQQTQSTIATTRTDVSVLKAKQNDLAGQIRRSKSDLSAVEGMTVEYSTLKHRVLELENNYQLYTQKRDESMMAADMDKQKLLNVAVAELPTLSFVPVKPRPLINISLGLFTAAFVACCFVFLAEMSRDTVSNARELEAASRYRVLASVPKAYALKLDDHELAALRAYPIYADSSWSGEEPVGSNNLRQW
jgi:uncharacterized protein involved in exopolysaccharide biosynthesis